MKKIVAGVITFILFLSAGYFIAGQINIRAVKLTPAPPPIKGQASPQTTVILAFGDSGTGSDSQKKLATLMDKYNFDVVLHTGDLAYGSGNSQEIEKNYVQIYSDKLRTKFHPTLGNHDYVTSSGQPYLDYFTLPKMALSPADNERYYSFDTSNVHFVALDSNRPLDQISEARTDDMADWLERDLAGADPAKKKIVYFHHPAFSSGLVHGSDARVQEKLMPLFDKYKVDLVLNGHEHTFERTCKINFTVSRSSCAQDGTVYIVTGGGGGESLYSFGTKQWFTAARESAYHFVLLTVENNQIQEEAIDLNGNLIDNAVL